MPHTRRCARDRVVARWPTSPWRWLLLLVLVACAMAPSGCLGMSIIPCAQLVSSRPTSAMNAMLNVSKASELDRSAGGDGVVKLTNCTISTPTALLFVATSPARAEEIALVRVEFDSLTVVDPEGSVQLITDQGSTATTVPPASDEDRFIQGVHLVLRDAFVNRSVQYAGGSSSFMSWTDVNTVANVSWSILDSVIDIRSVANDDASAFCLAPRGSLTAANSSSRPSAVNVSWQLLRSRVRVSHTSLGSACALGSDEGPSKLESLAFVSEQSTVATSSTWRSAVTLGIASLSKPCHVVGVQGTAIDSVLDAESARGSVSVLGIASLLGSSMRDVQLKASVNAVLRGTVASSFDFTAVTVLGIALASDDTGSNATAIEGVTLEASGNSSVVAVGWDGAGAVSAMGIVLRGGSGAPIPLVATLRDINLTAMGASQVVAKGGLAVAAVGVSLTSNVVGAQVRELSIRIEAAQVYVESPFAVPAAAAGIAIAAGGQSRLNSSHIYLTAAFASTVVCQASHAVAALGIALFGNDWSSPCVAHVTDATFAATAASNVTTVAKRNTNTCASTSLGVALAGPAVDARVSNLAMLSVASNVDSAGNCNSVNAMGLSFATQIPDGGDGNVTLTNVSMFAINGSNVSSAAIHASSALGIAVGGGVITLTVINVSTLTENSVLSSVGTGSAVSLFGIAVASHTSFVSVHDWKGAIQHSILHATADGHAVANAGLSTYTDKGTVWLIDEVSMVALFSNVTTMNPDHFGVSSLGFAADGGASYVTVTLVNIFVSIGDSSVTTFGKISTSSIGIAASCAQDSKVNVSSISIVSFRSRVKTVGRSALANMGMAVYGMSCEHSGVIVILYGSTIDTAGDDLAIAGGGISHASAGAVGHRASRTRITSIDSDVSVVGALGVAVTAISVFGEGAIDGDFTDIALNAVRSRLVAKGVRGVSGLGISQTNAIGSRCNVRQFVVTAEWTNLYVDGTYACVCALGIAAYANSVDVSAVDVTLSATDTNVSGTAGFHSLAALGISADGGVLGALLDVRSTTFRADASNVTAFAAGNAVSTVGFAASSGNTQVIIHDIDVTIVDSRVASRGQLAVTSGGATVYSGTVGLIEGVNVSVVIVRSSIFSGNSSSLSTLVTTSTSAAGFSMQCQQGSPIRLAKISAMAFHSDLTALGTAVVGILGVAARMNVDDSSITLGGVLFSATNSTISVRALDVLAVSLGIALLSGRKLSLVAGECLFYALNQTVAITSCDQGVAASLGMALVTGDVSLRLDDVSFVSERNVTISVVSPPATCQTCAALGVTVMGGTTDREPSVLSDVVVIASELTTVRLTGCLTGCVLFSVVPTLTSMLVSSAASWSMRLGRYSNSLIACRSDILGSGRISVGPTAEVARQVVSPPPTTQLVTNFSIVVLGSTVSSNEDSACFSAVPPPASTTGRTGVETVFFAVRLNCTGVEGWRKTFATADPRLGRGARVSVAGGAPDTDATVELFPGLSLIAQPTNITVNALSDLTVTLALTSGADTASATNAVFSSCPMYQIRSAWISMRLRNAAHVAGLDRTTQRKRSESHSLSIAGQPPRSRSPTLVASPDPATVSPIDSTLSVTATDTNLTDHSAGGSPATVTPSHATSTSSGSPPPPTIQALTGASPTVSNPTLSTGRSSATEVRDVNLTSSSTTPPDLARLLRTESSLDGIARAANTAAAGGGAATAFVAGLGSPVAASAASKATQLGRTRQLGNCAPPAGGAVDDDVDDAAFLWVRDASWSRSASVAFVSTSVGLLLAGAVVAVVPHVPAAAGAFTAFVVYFAPNVAGLAARALSSGILSSSQVVAAAVSGLMAIGSVGAASWLVVTRWGEGVGRGAQMVRFFVEGARDPNVSLLRRVHGIVDLAAATFVAIISSVQYGRHSLCGVAAVMVVLVYLLQLAYLVRARPLTSKADFILACVNVVAMAALGMLSSASVWLASSSSSQPTRDQVKLLATYVALLLTGLFYAELVWEVVHVVRRYWLHGGGGHALSAAAPTKSTAMGPHGDGDHHDRPMEPLLTSVPTQRVLDDYPVRESGSQAPGGDDFAVGSSKPGVNRREANPLSQHGVHLARGDI